MKRLLHTPQLLLSFAVVALLSVSCETAAIDETPQPITATSDITFEGVVSTRATDTAFESGDEISVTAYNDDGSIYASDVSYSYSNSVFSSSSAIRYESDEHTLSFRAIYPYMELPESNIIPFSVLTDQRSDSNYTLSDLMTSSVSSTTSTTPKLTFKHLLTKVIINVTSEDIAMTNVTTTLNVATKTDFNLSTLACITNEAKSDITMAEYGTNSYKAIIAPQNIEAGALFGTISVDGVVFDIEFENGKLFYSGREYEFDLSIREGSLVFVSSSIDDWEDGDDSSEGSDTFSLGEISSTSYPTNSKLWIITDEEVTSSSDFSGLTSALSTYRWATGERPMLSFPNLKSLPEKALYNCDNFESISLPEATYIGINAFYDCDYLTLVEAPLVESVDTYAFSNCSALTTIDLSAAATIGNCAFQSCTALALLELPAAATVGTNVFYGCTALTSLTLATTSELKIFGDSSSNVFYDVDISKIDLTVGSSVDVCGKVLLAPIADNGIVTYGSFGSITGGTEYQDVVITAITEYSATNYPVFSNDWVIEDSETPLANYVGLNEALTSAGKAGRKINLSFPNLEKFPSTAFYIDKAASITSIASVSAPVATEVGMYAFYGATSLTTISMDNIETVGDYAFYECKALAELPIDKVTSIGSNAFYDCDALTEISLPEMTSIGSYVFDGCSSLTSISLPEMTSIKSCTFRNCSSLTSISLPEVTSIESYAFRNCSSLTSISLPEVTSIGGTQAFYGCSSLTSISLPEVTSIGSEVFCNCSSLTSISLPEVTSIGSEAFLYCSSLTEITLPKATTVGYAAFSGCSSLTTVDLPLVTTLGTYSYSYSSYGAFYNCTRLQSVSLPSLSVIYNNTFSSCYMLYNLEIASNEGVALRWFGTSGSDLFDGIDISYMTLTTSETNASMVSGNYLTAPAYSSGYLSSTFYTTDQTYGPFKEIIIKEYE